MVNLKECLAEISSDTQLSYLDTGLPENKPGSYDTYILIPGIGHNKCLKYFRALLETLD